MKEEAFVLTLDVVSGIAVLLSCFTSDEVRAYIMLGVLIAGFVAYHFTSAFLLKRIRKEKIELEVSDRVSKLHEIIAEPDVIERSSLLDGGIYSADCPKCGTTQVFGTIKKNCGSVSKCDNCGQLIGWFEIYNAKNWQTTASTGLEDHI